MRDYKLHKFTIVNTEWQVVVGVDTESGDVLRVTVVKTATARVFRTLGKDYNSFTEAKSNYKSDVMKAELDKIGSLYKKVEPKQVKYLCVKRLTNVSISKA